MKTNLNIIKIFVIIFLSLNRLYADYTWISDSCMAVGCKGCSSIKQKIIGAADDIDDRHEELENKISEKYQDDILDKNLKKIDTIQVGITKSVARINAMEHEANIDTKKLIFMLRKNKESYTLPVGVSK